MIARLVVGSLVASLAFRFAPLQPQAVIIATVRGETTVPVSTDRGGAAVAAPLLAGPLELVVVLEGTQAAVTLSGTGFVFQLGVPYVTAGSVVCPMAGEPYVARDTLYLPLSWLADCVPRVLAPRYHWNAAAARLDVRPPAAPVAAAPARADGSAAETAATLVVTRPPTVTPPPTAATPPAAANPLTGLRHRHTIVVDPGHGGRDPGNPGLYFPDGRTEKDITLAIGKLLRAELQRRGLTATLTRASDTLIDLADRAGYCRASCDLFVSIHVNAMPPGRHREQASGVETYFLSEAKTEDQKRVAQMENDAIRFETDAPTLPTGGLGQIIKDLQANEYLRESARLAELVQGSVRAVHPGDDRGVQQAGFMVLTTARRPAVLVETGFATNKDDGAFLASALGQRKIANAIADGIVAYLLQFERKLAVVGQGAGR
jgi:N-acetylmuramoyl-L-alanine amidase